MFQKISCVKFFFFFIIKMTKTDYELTIGGKLRKVYKTNNGFFVKMNSKNLDVNEYFLKNGGGLKSKYKKKYMVGIVMIMIILFIYN